MSYTRFRFEIRGAEEERLPTDYGLPNAFAFDLLPDTS